MSKTVSTTLLRAQKAATRTPYKKVEYYDGSNFIDATSDLLLPLDYELHPYDGKCIIRLSNRKGTYNSFDYAFQQARITTGLTTGQGPEYQSTDTYLPYLWVTDWQRVSSSGQAYIDIICEPIWSIIERWKCDEDKTWADGDNTIKEILTYVLAAIGITIGTSISEDTHFDTDQPEFSVAINEDGLTITQRLMEMTDCWLVPRTDTVHAKHLQDADTAVATYHTVPNTGQHSCFWFSEEDGQYSPTKVTVEYDADGSSSNYDASEAITFEQYRIRHDLDVTESLALATTLVKRAQRERVQGSASMPVDFAPELYDVVTIKDKRTGKEVSTSSRIGGIRYYLAKNVFNMGISFGGVYEGVSIPVQATPAEDPKIQDLLERIQKEQKNIAEYEELIAEHPDRRANIKTWTKAIEKSQERILKYEASLGQYPPSGSALQLQTPTFSDKFLSIFTNQLADNVITTLKISALSVTAAKIANLTITAAQIANLTITSAQIANATITTTQISGTAGITGGQIASATITATNITNATITATQIANATITTTQIHGTAGITGSQIANATITTTQISGSAAITGSQIASATITSANIANATITTTQISGSAGITGSQIANATITTTQIHGTAGITGSQIANATITTTQISGTAAITGSQIANVTIAAGNIVNSTITATQIANATITYTQIANQTIIATNIGNGEITTTQISNTAGITGTQIANTTITGGNIVNNTVTVGKVNLPTHFVSGTFTDASPSAGYVAWADATVDYAGTTYSITNGNTDSKYIWWDYSASTTTFQAAAALPTLANEDVLVATNTSGVHRLVWNATDVNGDQIQLAAITGSLIANTTITGSNLVNNTITATQIYAATITGTEIAATTIAGSNLINNTITATQIENATITTTQIHGTAGITGAQIANATITTTQIHGTAGITGAQIANATITTTQISGTAGITGSQIASATITGSNIGATTIEAANIANATITTTQISGTAGITGAQIANATITTTQIHGTAGITGSQIANTTIAAANIVNATITTTQVSATAAITGSQLADAAGITGSQIAATTIEAGNIANATITTTQISGTAGITGSQLANTTVTSTQIANATITTTQIHATAGITGAQVAATTIEAGNIANATITTTQIHGTAGITGAQIANTTITATQIANATITTTQIHGTAGITGAQIANATITTTQISGTAGITGSQIAAATITASNMENATITATQIANATITATQITNLTVTATQIANATITYGKIGDGGWAYEGIQWKTAFESLDGFDSAVGGSGVITLSGTHLKLNTDTTDGSYAYVYKVLTYGTVIGVWTKNRRFKVRPFLYNAADQTIGIGTGHAGTASWLWTNRHLGFKIDGTTVYGTVADGTTQATTELITLDANEQVELEVVFTAGTSCAFYVDGTLEGTITTNLPTGGTSAEILLWVRIENDAAADKTIRLSDWYFLQEP